MHAVEDPTHPTAPGQHAAAGVSDPSPRGTRPSWEGPLWLLAGFLLSVVLTWPLVRSLRTAVPQDAGDPVAQAWQAAWGGHALLTQPGRLFDANAFFPATPSLAFSDSLLGYAPAALLGEGAGAALLRYNLLFLFAYALCFAAAALLGRELGLSVPAAVVVGVAYAWAPWRMAQNGHLNILSTGGVALTLFLLLSGYRRGRAWQVVAGWLTAAWQLSLGFALGIWFCYLLAALAAVTAGWWLVRGRPSLAAYRGLLVATVAGGLVFLLSAVLLVRPYLTVVSANPDAARGLAEIEFFSPPLRSLLAADSTNRVWGETTRTLRETLPWAPEQTLFPGLVVVALALVGLRWRHVARWVRAGMLVALGIVLVLSFGLSFLDGRLYLPLYDHLPGWDGLRTPGRLAFVWTLLLALLAGMGAQRLADALAPRSGGPRAAALPAAALVGLAAAVLYEGSPRLPIATPPPPPAALAGLAEPLAHLPSTPGADSTYMWWSTAGFPRIANGNGSYVPPELASLRDQTAGFPDAGSVQLLRDRGVRTVVVHRALLPGTPWDGAADRPVDGLGIGREDAGDVVVFDLAG
jgi:hypothetical protein